ncbi:1-phosphofructokinase family hexose kinase [Roseomonas sp. F4]
MAALFVTLSLNPAIDQTVELDRLCPGEVNLARGAVRHAAGKGINVAACLADWGASVRAVGLLGEGNDAPFRALFAARGIADGCLRIPGETRTNIKLLDRATGATTDINLPGAAPGAAALDQVLDSLRKAAGPGRVAVLSGSLPPGVPTDVYATLLPRLTGARVVADTSGAALAALLAGPVLPDAIKPNRHELEAWAGQALGDRAALLGAARGLSARGIGVVAVSLGAEGAIFVSQGQAVLVRPPALAGGSSVGAGDAMVAGIAAALAEDLPLPDLARRASAFSAAKLRRAGAGLPARAEVEAIAAALHAETLA